MISSEDVVEFLFEGEKEAAEESSPNGKQRGEESVMVALADLMERLLQRYKVVGLMPLHIRG